MDLEAPFPWNVGIGTDNQRTTALIYCAMDHPNVITRHVCREILADKINRALKSGHSAGRKHGSTD